MSAVSLIFPHQLFEKHPAISNNRPIFLIEELLFFTQYNFHKQKLVFHRASMKGYQRFLESKGYAVTYIEAKEKVSDIRVLLTDLKQKGISEIHYTNVTDYLLEKRIAELSLKLKIKVSKSDSLLFLLTAQQVDHYFVGKKRFFQTDFYTQQRKHFKILVDEKQQPEGGKWTFDTENRLKYPKEKRPPEIKFPKPNEYWNEAVTYINKNFSSNYGEINNSFIYPTTFSESSAWLKQFLQKRFAEFGDYEDALVNNESVLHHSLLTPMLNVGLLTPDEIVNQAISYAHENKIPLNSCEGFVRQLLGWREFIRGVYQTKGTQERTTNYWKFKRKIPASFWNGTTGIAPIDSTIKKVLTTGYCHHIERLMVLGNFMLLCEFDPDEVYKWFMELFIDSYDWVMVPNVYGMSQFADGGLMATKPYISGSNYLMKMSDYPKGDWQPIWDGLFWRFMHVHRDFFLKNPRLGMLVKTFDKMSDEKRQGHIQQAEKYLKKLGGK
ncbi:MAG: cryptochrome/photolyase family protein [Cytophagales bacterium]|jgi:deoxyribodipyrimidine photolyase-related protein|nr:cryptochrome/photolyase family protein [Cytophagales bacterium]MCA6387204.1 cryptochrome/photolyase family protein [Cytophagales bacterium]MCA6392950.1 cryptochrome/photolyase family protein [Cytophagales bacterium]MCA6394599.1 cryptochrome/photolyase family protein [Cytophagales bacterium]MCA6400926.1 cryptochrome/photolyase family protein [Cytophagales bacterium]